MSSGLNHPKLQIGVIGCGSITRNVHLPVLNALPGVQAAWIADTNSAAGRALSHDSSIPFHQISLPDIRVPSADIVVLAIPNGVRDSYYNYFAGDQETALYVEKPLAKSLSEHGSIVADKAPWQVAIGYDRRSFGLTRLVRDLFTHRPFGKPESIKIRFGGLGRVLIGNSFMSDAVLAGGGALFQMGVHFLDAVLFASEAEDVALLDGRMITELGMDIHVEGLLDLKLKGEERVPLSILVTQLQPADNRIEITFAGATVSFSVMYGERSLTVAPRTTGCANWNLVPEARTGPLDMFASFGMHWTNVIDAVRSRTANYTSASQAVLTTKAIELLYALPAEGSP